MIRHLRKSLVTGVVVLVPIVVTIKVLQILFNFTDGILGNAVTRILNRPIPGLGLLLFLILIYLVGIIYRTFFGKRMLVWTEQVIEMIPVARTIYSGVKQLVGPFVGDESEKTFGRAVLVEYPSPGIYTYGFLVKEQVGPNGSMANVFVSSNHLHLGVVILVDRRSLIELDISFEEMIKLMASCGVAAPDIHASRLPGAAAVRPPDAAIRP